MLENLVLIGDVAGDVGRDREVFDQAEIDLDEEDKSANAEEYEVLELLQKLKHTYPSCKIHCSVNCSEITRIGLHIT